MDPKDIAAIVAATIAALGIAPASPGAATVATPAPVKARKVYSDGLEAPDRKAAVRDTPCTAQHPATTFYGVAIPAGLPCDRMFGADSTASASHGASKGGHEAHYMRKA